MEMLPAVVQEPRVEPLKTQSVLIAARPGRERDSLCVVLKFAGINIIGQADDGASASRMVSESRPALVFLDTNLPGAEALDVLKHIKAQEPQIRCLVLADDSQQLKQAQAAGADAALLKGFLTCELFEAIDALLSARGAA